MNENAQQNVVELKHYRSPFSFREKCRRALWGVVNVLLFQPSPRILFGWRRFVLRRFGAQIGQHARIYPKARVFAPWNLRMGDYSGIGDYVECYCVDKITIAHNASVSSYTQLITATHDINDPAWKTVTAPIVINEGAIVFQDAFIMPGITVGTGAVVAARALVTKDVPAWSVVAGHPAKVIKTRVIKPS